MKEYDSGFYVLEDERGKIVAQSWAWVSKDKRLVFDSLEVVGEEVKGSCLQYYHQFAKRVVSTGKFEQVILGSERLDDRYPFGGADFGSGSRRMIEMPRRDGYEYNSEGALHILETIHDLMKPDEDFYNQIVFDTLIESADAETLRNVFKDYKESLSVRDSAKIYFRLFFDETEESESMSVEILDFFITSRYHYAFAIELSEIALYESSFRGWDYASKILKMHEEIYQKMSGVNAVQYYKFAFKYDQQFVLARIRSNPRIPGKIFDSMLVFAIDEGDVAGVRDMMPHLKIHSYSRSRALIFDRIVKIYDMDKEMYAEACKYFCQLPEDKLAKMSGRYPTMDAMESLVSRLIAEGVIEKDVNYELLKKLVKVGFIRITDKCEKLNAYFLDRGHVDKLVELCQVSASPLAYSLTDKQMFTVIKVCVDRRDYKRDNKGLAKVILNLKRQNRELLMNQFKDDVKEEFCLGSIDVRHGDLARHRVFRLKVKNLAILEELVKSTMHNSPNESAAVESIEGFFAECGDLGLAEIEKRDLVEAVAKDYEAIKGLETRGRVRERANIKAYSELNSEVVNLIREKVHMVERNLSPKRQALDLAEALRGVKLEEDKPRDSMCGRLMKSAKSMMWRGR